MCFWQPWHLGLGRQKGNRFWVSVEGMAGASLAWGRAAERCPLLPPTPGQAGPRCAAPPPAPQLPFVWVATAQCQLLAAAGTTTPSQQSCCGAGSGPRTSLTAKAGLQCTGVDVAPFLLGLLPGLGFPTFLAPVASKTALGLVPHELLGGTPGFGVCSWGQGVACVSPFPKPECGDAGAGSPSLCWGVPWEGHLTEPHKGSPSPVMLLCETPT